LYTRILRGFLFLCRLYLNLAPADRNMVSFDKAI
jgi:hypothetical protein